MKKILSLLLHPFFLPLFVTAVFVALLPIDFSRYTLEIVERKTFDENMYLFYDDLTMDGNSEAIYLSERKKMVWVMIYNANGNLIDQWNFRGTLAYTQKNSFYITGDYDGSGSKELFLFTLMNDSIFLNAVGDLSERDALFRNIFIDKVGPGTSPVPDARILSAEMEDLNGDGKKELIFGITAGFSLQPRNVYAYYIDQDSLVKSPESFYNLFGLVQADINGDGVRELILHGTSTANVLPEKARYHDFSNWLMVLNKNLEFLLEPLELPGQYLVFKPFAIFRNGKTELHAAVYFDPGEVSPRIYSFSPDGSILKVRDFDFQIFQVDVITDKKNNQILVFFTKDGLRLFNTDFKYLRDIPGIKKGEIYQADLEGDGMNELILVNQRHSLITVSRGKFRNMTSLGNIDWTFNRTLFSIKESPGQRSLISLQLGRHHYLFRYGPNNKLYLSFIWVFLIYVGMLVFSATVRKIQRIQLQESFKTERRIAELQLKLVKNQLEPHFVLNAINTIIHNLTNNEADKASNSLIRFSRLYRSLLLSSGSIQRTLSEELDFCMDYIELEKVRFNDSFKFQVNFNQKVNMDFMIPGMIIQTHVENSLKHGLSDRKNGGFIAVSLDSTPEGLLIQVRDNGIGRKNASLKKNNSTGKGLELMKEYQELYNKLFGKSISHEVEDLCNEKGEPAGTMVKILISHNHEN